MCQFLILPLVFGPPTNQYQYWLPQMNGNYTDTQNRTHFLKHCTRTSNGLICGQHSPIYKPCFLQHSINLCHRTILPPTFEMF